MGLFALLDVARDGMTAQATALNITGQNVSNASNPNYARRAALLETVASPGAFGSVRVAGITRTVDRFAETRAVAEGGLYGGAFARSGALAETEAILAPPGAKSIADRLSAFFSAFSALAQNPGDPSVRASTLAATQDLTQSISTTASQLGDQRASLLQSARDVAGDVNEKLSKIADLNRQIMEAKGLGNSPADMMDQRDQLVREVGERVGAQALEQADGSITLLSSGAALVEGQRASRLSIDTDTTGALAVKLVRPTGQIDDVTANVTVGSLAGIKEARDVDLPGTLRALDQMAFDLATTVNAAHSAGYGIDGGTGRDLFTAPTAVAGAARAMSVSAAVLANPKAIATAATAGSVPGGNDVALAISQLAEKPLSGAPTPGQAFAKVGAIVGNAKQAADSEVTLRDATRTQAINRRESASGVSVDEEMVNLSKFQQAYQASLKVLQTVNELLDGLVRGM